MKSLNDVLYLMSCVRTEDEDGFLSIDSEQKKEVFCGTKSVSQNEFYNAMRGGVKVSVIFVVSADDYENEKKIEYQDRKFDVVRSYKTGENYIELTCSEVE